MEDARLHEGDRVRSVITTQYITAGMVGTIHRVFLSVDDTYDVLFDDKQRLVMMHRHELERAEQEQESAS